MERKRLEKQGWGRLHALACGYWDEEAPPGFEPGMKVLQTSALPLGYGAAVWVGSTKSRGNNRKSTLTSPWHSGKGFC